MQIFRFSGIFYDPAPGRPATGARRLATAGGAGYPGRMTPWFRAKRLAVRRRLALRLTGRFDPYPPAPEGAALEPSAAHAELFDRAPLALSWRRAGIEDPLAWQDAARERLASLLGVEGDRPAPEAHHAGDHDLPGGLRRRHLYLRTAPARDVPVDLVWRPGAPEPAPVMICLQGTNSGAHLSWGEARMPADPIKVATGGDYAVQAAERGYLAVCVEQSCFGERRERSLIAAGDDPCVTAANHALLLGRSLLGERVEDVASVIDWLAGGDFPADAGPRPDVGRIHAMGNSSGGTTAVFAAALDRRIAAVLAGGCVGPLRETLARRRDVSGQAVVPGILRWMEYDDVLALIAPRPVLVVSGTRDHIYPYDGAARAVEGARAVYRALGAGEAIRAVAADGPHRFYPEVAWPAFEALLAERRRLAPGGA